MLVYSFGCSYETADIEFAFTLSQALDKGNIVISDSFVLSSLAYPGGGRELGVENVKKIN